MLINTHFIISKVVLEKVENRKTFFINEKHFIYGNIKPDISSKYLLNKHYLNESLSMILDKIKNLSNLTLDSLNKYFPISRLSQELGVICHFLCDFFTTPHSERWRFTHSIDTINKHVSYEKGLNEFAKQINFFDTNINLNHKIDTDIDEFFHNLYSEYKENCTSFENDLKFSLHACCEVIDHILDSILINTAKSYTLQSCI